jgi:pyruvate formate lyase activating enzyme
MSMATRFQLYDPRLRHKGEDTGLVSDFQRFSIHDGPGIRTIVFLKGCPLRCAWCQNPETLSHLPEIMLVSNNCIGCGKCLGVCPNDSISHTGGHVSAIDRECCALPECGKCQNACYANAINICGRYLTVADVIYEMERDMEFYFRTGGGITFSGGEPFAQPRFLEKLVKEVKEMKLHTAIETCGYCKWETMQPILGLMDLVLYDVKHMDPDRHRQGTGASNELILENLKRVDSLGIPVRARLPLVPGFNDSAENICATASFVSRLANLEALDILPYHRMGEPKWGQLGKPYGMHGIAPHTRGQVYGCAEIARKFDIVVTVGG